jgi:pilus assembly protein CpaC
LQGGGAGVGQVTIQFRDFGIKLNFTPTITPRGTIRLQVNPEVSSLDYANGLSVSGFTVPGLTTRRVDTEVELKDGQSFVIAGLLNNQVTEQLSRMPGMASIPLLGKLFQSRSVSKSNSELLILVTPEIVNPLPAGQTGPDIAMDEHFLKGTASQSPQQPHAADAPTMQDSWRRDSLPVEDMKASTASSSSAVFPTATAPSVDTPANGPLPTSTGTSGDTSHPKN